MERSIYRPCKVCGELHEKIDLKPDDLVLVLSSERAYEKDQKLLIGKIGKVYDWKTGFNSDSWVRLQFPKNQPGCDRYGCMPGSDAYGRANFAPCELRKIGTLR